MIIIMVVVTIECPRPRTFILQQKGNQTNLYKTGEAIKAKQSGKKRL